MDRAISVSRCEICNDPFYYALKGRLSGEEEKLEGVLVDGKWIHEKCCLEDSK